jgi:alpha-L-glutamate ligase-like protein
MFSLLNNSSAILGMNARNLAYIRPNNKRRARDIADDKLRSKRILAKAGLPVPELLASIRDRRDLENFDWSTLPSSFALKPARGLGGDGIVIVFGRKKGAENTWVKADGKTLTHKDLANHIENILEGMYSLTNSPDVAFFEERLKLDPSLKPYSYRGIPDVRVIVYNSVPVMAMLRLPTKSSSGKANLHLGGVGAGIDMATGVTTTAILGKSKSIEYIPGTRFLASGIKVPYWKDILTMAVKAQQETDIGFLGADIAIDRERGPVILELNIRPGLSIQLCNKAGLKDRLERVKGLKIKSVQRGVRVGMNLFGGEIEEELEEISGKRVIGSVENVKLIGRNETEIRIDAKIDTGARTSSIDTTLARKLGFGKTLDAFEKMEELRDPHKLEEIRNMKNSETKKLYAKQVPYLEYLAVVSSSSGISVRPFVKLTFIMDKKIISSYVNIIDRSKLQYPMIIGKRDLSKFLVDVSK